MSGNSSPYSSYLPVPVDELVLTCRGEEGPRVMPPPHISLHLGKDHQPPSGGGKAGFGAPLCSQLCMSEEGECSKPSHLGRVLSGSQAVPSASSQV